MNLKHKFTVLIFLFIVSGTSHALPAAKVTYKVISQNGKPIEGVKIRAGFRGYSTKSTVEEGFTIEGGMFTASGDTQYEVVASINKEGYYNSGSTFGGNDFTGVSGIIGFRRWQPWNPTITVVLKKIKNPIALYMRDVGSKTIYKDVDEDPSSFLTTMGKYIGFDLIASDWVVPHGSGTRSDFLFKLDKDYNAPGDFKHALTISFKNQGDGIQSYYTKNNNSSVFKMPFHAPKTSYKNQLIQTYIDRPKVVERDIYRTDQNYFFRVRTELDDKGNVVSALYGKIEGNIQFPSGTERPLARLKFKYFLNPTTNDTNLEFDQTKNLFRDKFRITE